jgi:hypothetical protein
MPQERLSPTMRQTHVKVLTTARHVSKDSGSPEAGASAECAVGAEGAGTGEGAIRRSPPSRSTCHGEAGAAPTPRRRQSITRE